jgi:hypothetical protein
MKNEQLLVIELIVIPQIHPEVSHSRQAKGKDYKTKPGTGLGIVVDSRNSGFATQYVLCFSLNFIALNPYRVVTPLIQIIY